MDGDFHGAVWGHYDGAVDGYLMQYFVTAEEFDDDETGVASDRV